MDKYRAIGGAGAYRCGSRSSRSLRRNRIRRVFDRLCTFLQRFHIASDRRIRVVIRTAAVAYTRRAVVEVVYGLIFEEIRALARHAINDASAEMIVRGPQPASSGGTLRFFRKFGIVFGFSLRY